MQIELSQFRKTLSKDLTDIMIRFGLVAFLVLVSVKIFSPFMGLMLWGLILAVTLYPLHQKLADKWGGKQGRAATLIVLSGILIIGVPTIFLGASAVDYAQEMHSAFEKNKFAVKPPATSVAEWPVIGPKLYEFWRKAATDLPALLEDIQPQLVVVSKSVLSFLAGTAGGILQFLVALIVAGIMMAYGRSGSESMLRITRRLTTPEQGNALFKLSVATIRSVSVGVIGVAFIQALLLGVGFIFAGIPAAGLLAIVILVLGIAQLPATLITLPVIAYMWWSGDSTLSNVFFTVYLLVAGLADNILKPMFLGRGVDAPMPIILLGALGGMVTAGLIGLFVGSVLLSLGYVIFMGWVADGEVEVGDLEMESNNSGISNSN